MIPASVSLPKSPLGVSTGERIRWVSHALIVLLLAGSAAAKWASVAIAGEDVRVVRAASLFPVPPIAQQIAISALEFAVVLGALWAGPRLATFVATLWLGGMMALGRAIHMSFLPEDASCGCLGFWPSLRIGWLNALAVVVLGTLLFSSSIGILTHLLQNFRCKRT